jgi:glutathione S-transferase
MIEVHHLNNSRSQRIVWLLEELQTPYKVVVHWRDKQTMLAPPSLTDIHPLGKSPVITDGEIVLPESGAIVEYLVETYGADKLAPKRGTKDYVRYLYWLHYAEGSLMAPVLFGMYAKRMGDAGGLLSGRAASQSKLHLDFIEGELTKAPHFVGAQFTGADVLMSFPLEMFQVSGALDAFPKTKEYLARMQARPAYKKALATGEAPYDMSGIMGRRS